MNKPLEPDMIYHLKSASDPALSPDGSRLAYTRSWVERDESGSIESLSRLMMIGLDGGGEREFTQGRADSAPRFSPDGGRLAFLRVADGGVRQVWVIHAAGGEARQLTTFPKGVADFAWSPDGGRLVICADTGDGPDTSEKRAAPSVPEVTVVSRIRYRYDPLGWRGDAHFHLFVADAESGAATQLTTGDWDDMHPVWSPDGLHIAFISERRDDRDLLALTEAYAVPAGGGEAELWSQGLFSIGSVAWSPDGQRLAVVGSDAPEGMAVWQGWIYVLERGREPVRVTDDEVKPSVSFPATNRQPEIRWTEDGRVLFLGESRGESFLFQAEVDGGGQKALWGGSCLAAGLSFDRGAHRAVTAVASPNSPVDLYQVEIPSGQAAQITSLNQPYLAEHPAASMEKFCIQRPENPAPGADGVEIECRLWFPPGFDSAKTYPLILDIHGGPNGAFYDAFVPIQQALATAGYLVLAVNPRGSSTYGDDFMMAVLGDWGGEDYQDLMSAVDEVSRRPYVDANKLGVHGYSYGGYMTSWTVGHTSRFRAAVAGAPCINLYSMYGTSDIGISFGEAQWGGSLAGAAAAMLERSPITYASSVETPVLLLHGEADARCPIAQSEEYFTILKRLGKEVEFVRFPGCAHGFPRTGHPRMREEYMARTLAWFEQRLA